MNLINDERMGQIEEQFDISISTYTSICTNDYDLSAREITTINFEITEFDGDAAMDGSVMVIVDAEGFKYWLDSITVKDFNAINFDLDESDIEEIFEELFDNDYENIRIESKIAKYLFSKIEESITV